jgi:hypothetical protein
MVTKHGTVKSQKTALKFFLPIRFWTILCLDYNYHVFTQVINYHSLVRKVFTYNYFPVSVITQKLNYNFCECNCKRKKYFFGHVIVTVFHYFYSGGCQCLLEICVTKNIQNVTSSRKLQHIAVLQLIFYFEAFSLKLQLFASKILRKI